MTIKNNLKYSIVVCTYNPDEQIMTRCLNAIQNLHVQDIDYEIILVDNNSQPKLNSLAYIQEFFDNTPNSRYVVEETQGLTHARIRGAEEASGDYVLFFDDDNEPYPDYLKKLKQLHIDYPTVVAWGPGNVWVDFIGGVNRDVKLDTIEYAKVDLFQERHERAITYGNNRAWERYYPYGTGLSVKRSYLIDYARKVQEDVYNAVDRKGESLSSGGDLQVVLFCIDKSAAVGVSPTLKVNHLIPNKRANMNYMKKLMFAVNVSYHKVMDEMLIEYKDKLIHSSPNSLKFACKAALKCGRDRLSSNQIKTLESLKTIGLDCGHYITINKPIPKIVKKVLKVYGIRSDSILL